MIQSVHFGANEYNIMLGALIFGRGMDLLSTWLASPNLMVEANPIARSLGWRWGGLVNVVLCFSVAFYPLAAVVVVTSSLMVAARNFKTAWLMRAMGEERYLVFMMNQMRGTDLRLYVFCLFAEGVLIALVGITVAYYSKIPSIPLGIGAGIVAYAIAVVFYSCLSLWRSR